MIACVAKLAMRFVGSTFSVLVWKFSKVEKVLIFLLYDFFVLCHFELWMMKHFEI